MTKIDAPFLSKFNRQSIYINSEEELHKSIIEEIGNILSTKLKISDAFEDSPFSYGVRDLQSVENEEESLNDFKRQCEAKILRYESRIEDLYVTSCKVNNLKQSLEIELECKLKNRDSSLSAQFTIGN